MFYEKPKRPLMDLPFFRNSHVSYSHSKSILAAVQRSSLSSTMIDYLYLKDTWANSAFASWALYEAVSAGNKGVAASIASCLNEAGGLNKVHLDVLTVGILPNATMIFIHFTNLGSVYS